MQQFHYEKLVKKEVKFKTGAIYVMTAAKIQIYCILFHTSFHLINFFLQQTPFHSMAHHSE